MDRFPGIDNGVYPFSFNIEDPVEDVELFKDIFEEGVRLHGNKCVYIRKEYLNEENTFGEYLTGILSKADEIYAFTEQVEGWDGPGDLFSKFGIRNSDEMTLHVPKNTFKKLGFVPKIGDVVYHVVTKSAWQIEDVDDGKKPSFHPLGQYISYVMTCKSYLFDHVEASKELMDSTNEHIDIITKVLFGDGTAVDNAIIEDVREKNDPIETVKSTIVDNSERDPLGF